MSNKTYLAQQQTATKMAEQLAGSGSAVGQAQVLALACGKAALAAKEEAGASYKLFVQELAQAVIDESGLSTSRPN